MQRISKLPPNSVTAVCSNRSDGGKVLLQVGD